MIRTIVVEDEINSQEVLLQMFDMYCDEIEVIGKASNVAEGVSIIKRTNPDLVCLDIEMPDGSGFDVLDQTQDMTFNVIIITGYDKYAIKAFKYAALDYLLKPIKIESLENSIQRLPDTNKPGKNNIIVLKEGISKGEINFTSIILADTKSNEIVDLNDITYIEAVGNYVKFHYLNKHKLITKTLNYYEDFLPSKQFHRIHRSYVINFRWLKSYDTGRNGNIELKNGIVLPIATRRKADFINRVKNKL